MAELTFSLAYTGPALDDGSMDVRSLAPALMALADVFRTANTTVNREAPPVSLEIRAAERGSFEIHLILTQPDFMGTLVSLLSGDQATALANLFQIVGGSAGLFGFIKLVGVRRILRRRSINVDTTRIELEDGVVLIVSNEVLALYQTVGIRRNVETVVAPLRSEGVDSMEIRRETTEVRIEKSDIQSFRAPALPSIELLDTTTELNLKIVAVTFQEGNLWRFSDGDRVFYAEMADELFMDRVFNSEEAFRNGDILRVALRIRQEQESTGDLRTSYIVEKVLEHIPRERLIQLPIEPV